MVVKPLEGVVMGLPVVETPLTEVKVCTDLTVVAWALNGVHRAASTPGQRRREEVGSKHQTW